MHSPLRLYGRSGELAILETLLGRLRAGDGGALVLTSPPGLGRTALLRQAAAHYLGRHGGPVLYAAAAPTEQRLPYSGLHALLCSAPGPLPVTPDTILGSGITPGGLLGLLRGLGVEQPLLVCVDDAHAWDPDSRAALGFAARRLGAGSRVAVVIGAADETAFAGLPALRLGPLDDDAATALLDRLTDGAADVDPVVRSELLREAAGNPRLLAGLVGRLTPGQLAGRTALPYPLPGAEGVLDAHAEHLHGLPPDTRALLLLAAAAEEHEPDGAGADAALLLRAGARAGLATAHLDRVLFAPAGTAGALQRAGSRVHFSHPLLRRAVLHRAPPGRRRAVHELLAGLLTGPGSAPLPALVQLACAAPGPDAALAGQLEAAATAPRPHGERSAALARAAALSTDEALRAARFAAAAEQARLAGDTGRARAMLAGPGRVGPHGGAGRRSRAGAAAYVRGMLALRDGPAADAREALLTAAELLAPTDPRRTLEALFGAAEAAWDMGDAIAYLDAMNRIPVTAADRSMAQYRAGMCAVLAGHPDRGHALLRCCLDSADRAEDADELLRAGASALVLGEVDAACRQGPAPSPSYAPGGPKPCCRTPWSSSRTPNCAPGSTRGPGPTHWRGCTRPAEPGQQNSATHLHSVLALAASVEGPAEACAAHADAALAGAGPHGLAQAAMLATWAVARADLAAGRPGEAAARLGPLVRPGPGTGHFATRTLAVPCCIEAMVLSGRADDSAGELRAGRGGVRAVDRPDDRPPGPRPAGPLPRPAGAAGKAAARYEEALAHHDRARRRLRARPHPAPPRPAAAPAGAVPREARGPLRDALVAFERCSARVWAERAGGELRAAGEAVDVPDQSGPGPLAGLTPQQQRIARCVAEGATNREVAVRLSVSPRTVDHHLRNVFAALGVRSRTELARLLDR